MQLFRRSGCAPRDCVVHLGQRPQKVELTYARLLDDAHLVEVVAPVEHREMVPPEVLEVLLPTSIGVARGVTKTSGFRVLPTAFGVQKKLCAWRNNARVCL